MISPVKSSTIRMDTAGSGKYGARRGKRWHKGVDYIAIPGEEVIAPISGRITRIAKPYANTDFSGIELQSANMTIKMFYFEPFLSVVGSYVSQGEPIGVMQDVSKHYMGGMKPHIHIQIEYINPDIFINQL